MNKKTKQICEFLFCVMLVFVLALAAGKLFDLQGSTSVYAEEVAHSGNYDGVDWEITSDGTLTLGNALADQELAAVSNRTQESYTWYPYRSTIKSVHIVGNIKAQGSLCGFFYEMDKATTIDGFDKFDTSNATSLRGMFYSVSAVQKLDMSHISTANATDIAGMFNGCNSLQELDLQSFDTEKVTNLANLFKDCYSLETIDISSFDTRGVTTMTGMFKNCYSLRKMLIGDNFKIPANNKPFTPVSELGTNKTFANADNGYAQLTGEFNSTTLGAYKGTWLEVATVAFDSNGGQGDMAEQLYYYGEPSKPLTANAFSNAPFVFVGWSTGSNILNDQANISFSDLLVMGMTGGQITMNATWATDLSSAEILLSENNFDYSGSDKKPIPTVILDKYKLTEGVDYVVSYSNNRNAAKSSDQVAPTVIITGKGDYTGIAKKTFTINKVNNPLVVKGKAVKVKYKKVKKKAQSLVRPKVLSISNAQGTLSYAKKRGNKKITINKTTGKVTVKKKLKKGKYKVKVKVTDSGNANYHASTKTVTITIRVK